MAGPLSPSLSARGAVVLDGGLATELEARGHRIDDALWSARLLLDAPDAVAGVHRDFLRAGADCVTTVTYQATHPGFARLGLGPDEVDRLLVRATELAREACAAVRTEGGRPGGTEGLLVAASVGPYGAFLADGSEYDGRYAVDRHALGDFHARRFGVLAGSGADLLACETVPSLVEAEVLLALLDDHPGVWAWMSFSCRDGRRLHDGSAFADAVRLCARHPRVCAVGINCTDPRFVASLVGVAREATKGDPTSERSSDTPAVVVYANSGEVWDATTRRWRPPPRDPGVPVSTAQPDAGTPARTESWRRGTRAALRAGARVVGGCCRVGVADIAWLRREVDGGDCPPLEPALLRP